MAKVRYQAEIDSAQIPQIEEVKNECGFRTHREMLNAAWALLFWVVRELMAGRTILSFDERTGSQKELAMPFFDTVRQKRRHSTPQRPVAVAVGNEN